MKWTRPWIASLLGGIVLYVGGRPPQASAAAVAPHERTSARAHRATARLPLAFEENRGQTDERVRFLVRDRGVVAFVCPTETVFALHSTDAQDEGDGPQRTEPVVRREVVRMRLVGAAESPTVESRGSLPGKRNYFVGNDRSRWVTDAPTSEHAVVTDAWPGIDVDWHGDAAGRLSYDLVAAPGADLRAIDIAIEGAKDVSVEPDGSLRIATELGELRQTRPVAYQRIDGRRRAVDAAFTVDGDRHVRFAVGPHDAGRSLVIDPSLNYSTFVGGSGVDNASGVATDSTGAVYLTGSTLSVNFPQLTQIQSWSGTTQCALVTKINAAGTAVVYATCLSGSSTVNRGNSIAVDSIGVAYVTGTTASTDFPFQSAIQSAYAGAPSDSFVAKLSASGSSLIYSTYLGGTGADVGYAIAVDSAGAVYVSGRTQGGFPMQNAIQSAYAGSYDVYLTKIAASGTSLVYSTYLGGSNSDIVFDLAIDGSGNAYVCGSTVSTNFPAASPLQASNSGGQDAFVLKVNSSGSALVYSTYLGGTADDFARAVAVDANGAVYAFGETTSADFPTVGAAQSVRLGARNAWVGKLTADGSSLVYSTYLGGTTGENAGGGVTVDSGGAATVCGVTGSSDFPTVSPSQSSLSGVSDCFVTTLAPDGATFTFSTFLGGSGDDNPGNSTIDSAGNLVVCGQTTSADFPTSSSLQSYAGSWDMFVVKYPFGSGGGGPPVVVPNAPTNLEAVYAQGQDVSLTWTDNSSDESGFRVERMPAGYDFTAIATKPADTTSALDVYLFPNTQYSYRVCAVNAGVWSAYSNVVTVTTGGEVPVPGPPSAPVQLRAEPTEEGAIHLYWSDASADELGFEVSRSVAGAEFKHLGATKANSTSAADDTVVAGWPYAYRVKAFSFQGPSPWSNVATATVPATVDLAVRSGVLAVSRKTGRANLTVVVSYAPTPFATSQSLDPVAYGSSLQLGFQSNPATLSIAPGDAGWRVRTKRSRRGAPLTATRATWRSPKGASPRWTVVFDLVRGTFKATVTGFLAPPEPAPDMRSLVGCGQDGGALSQAWTERRPGLFRYSAK